MLNLFIRLLYISHCDAERESRDFSTTFLLPFVVARLRGAPPLPTHRILESFVIHTQAYIHRKGPDVSLLKRGPNVCRQTRREVYIMYRAGFPLTPIKHLQQNVLLRNNNLCGENEVFIDAYYFLIWKLFMFHINVFWAIFE